MRITFVADVYGQTNNGTSITARRFVENMRARGHEVKIVSADENSDVVLPKRNFHCFNKYIEKLNGVSLAEPDEAKLRDAISKSDVVHFLLPFKCSKMGIKICEELEVPFTTAFHCQPENVSSHIGMKNWTFLNNRLYSYFLKSFYKNVHFIHCPSAFIADELTKHHYKAQKYVISNGVAEHIHPEKAEKPAKYKDKFVILNVARFSNEKRQDLLIKAAAYSKYSNKIQLIFAGNGPLRKKLEKMGNALKNKPIFAFFKNDEINKVFNYADIYVHPSDIEIEGISCIEAITCGQVPIISNSPRSATKQFALNEKCLFEMGDAKDLAKKIDYFIEHEEEKKALKQQYIEYAKQFNIKSCMDQMEQMLKDAIDFYKEYYALHPKKPTKPQIDYPEDNPQEHITKVKHNKTHKTVDEKFDYTKKKTSSTI